MLSIFELTSVLLLLCALFGFVNRAFLHLPNSVGLLLLGMIASLLLVAVELLFPEMQLYADIETTLRQIDFGEIVFDGMLAFLLFAGALHVDFGALRRRALAVSYLALVATVVSTGLIGSLFFLASQALALSVSLPWALVFGALISPTDPVDDFPIEVLITLALVTCTYALANRLGMSGPIATVAAGLLIGYRALKDAMSERTEGYVSALWTLIDEVLNAILFLLIGLEALVLKKPQQFLLVAAAAIPIVLVARFIAVALPLLLPIGRSSLSFKNVPFLTWAAIRGGISIALALSLPTVSAKPAIVASTYAVVIFSILVQGLTLSSFARLLKIETPSGRPSS